MNKDGLGLKKKWKREMSAGGVVYKKENGSVFILLIQPRSPNYGPPVGYWTYPKGRIGDIELNDTPEIAALREVKEEGGVEAKIISKLGSIKYNFRWEEKNIFKIVTYFLMEYVSGDPKDHDNEVAEADWFKLEEVESKLKFFHDKEILEKAREILKN